MAAALGLRRTAITAAGVGVAAGTIGTWFEMSHGVICIPVLTLPPLNLSQQVAAGSTVFGVAVREMLSATLYALDPDVDLNDRDRLEELVDVNALIGLSSVGTVAALGAAAASAKASTKFTRRANGVFCLGLALFLQWRESQMRAAREEVDVESHPERLDMDRQQERQRQQHASIPQYGARRGDLQVAPRQQLAVPPATEVRSTSLMDDWARLTALGAAAGSVLGFFGIGTAWMLAPILRHTAPGSALRSGEGTQFGEIDLTLSEPFGVDSRTRRTACLAMVLPSAASAFRHLNLGHVPQMGSVALPLAVGAIGGSALAGNFLEDVPADEELKTGVAALLFCYGIWCWFKPV